MPCIDFKKVFQRALDLFWPNDDRFLQYSFLQFFQEYLKVAEIEANQENIYKVIGVLEDELKGLRRENMRG